MNLFSSLIKLYRSQGLKTPLEDFTTEIFVNILETHPKIREKFVKDILKIDGDGFSISSQETFSFTKNSRTSCKIDIVFRNEDSICFLENKVHSVEGFGQLNNYCQVLDGLSQYKNRYLRFCTKFFQDKAHIVQHDFKQFRWCNIANFLSFWSEHQIIGIFLEFLEINKMGNSTDFTLHEVLALENFNPALLKMEAYLDKLKPRFRSIFGDFKIAKNMNQLKEHTRHVFWKENLFGNYYVELGVGFQFSGSPHLIVWIWVPEDSPSLKAFQDMLSKVNEGYNNAKDYFEYTKSLSDFISSESMETDIEEWFVNTFGKMKLMAESYPELEWNLPSKDVEC
ncbi:hypothetical protein ACVWYG_001973 [Pedobacter sp. UYEF25]